jgi:hypothetical protein
MRKIKLHDILDIAKYELVREDHRKKLLKIKASRRIFVKPRIMFAFENYDTMLYQVHEMIRAERMVKEEAILKEIRIYNDLIPDKGQLSATMFIATGNKHDDIRFLHRIDGLPEHTFLNINGERIIPQYDPGQIDDGRLSAVQYVKFQLNQKQVGRFNNGSRVVLGFDHKNYSEHYELTREQIDRLKGDFI